MKAIILAAGEGSRLRPHTLDRPKCLVPLLGRPLLETQLAVLRGQGVDDILLLGGYLAERLGYLGLPVILNPEYASSNMVWTLMRARPLLEAAKGPVIVSYGDIIYHPEALRALMRTPGDMVVAVDREWEAYWRLRFDDPLTDAETLRLDDAGRIAEIGQKPSALSQIQGQYMGLMLFTPAGLARLLRVFDRALARGELGGRPPRNAYLTDLLQAAIADGAELWPAFCSGQWVEVDTPQDLGLPENQGRAGAILACLGTIQVN